MNDPLYADVCFRLQQLSQVCAGMIPTRIPLEPRPSEIEAVNDDLLIIAKHVDAYLQAVGAYVAANTPGYFDQSLFKDQLIGAIEGNATYAIEEVAHCLREEMQEAIG